MNAPGTATAKTTEHIWLQRLATTASVIAVPLAVMTHGPVLAAADAVETCAPPVPFGRRMMLPPPGLMSDAQPRGVIPPPDGASRFPLLHDTRLTAEQRGKLFALMHAQAPFQRAKGQEAAKALDDLQRLATPDRFDAEKARALADTYARSLAELVLMHVELGAKMRAILTPEQRKQLDDARVKAESHRVAFKRS